MTADRSQQSWPPRLAVLLGVCALLVWGAPRAAAQSNAPIQVRTLGNQHGFTDEREPDRTVVVFQGGVEVQQGARLLLARRLVLVLRGGASGSDADGSTDDDASSLPAPESSNTGYIVPGSRVLELFLEGDVTLDEANERVVGAESIYVDNQTGTLSIERGTWRSKTGNNSLYVHFESMRRHPDGTRELRGVRATTCSSCDPDWNLETERATLQDTLDGQVLHTAGNVVEVGGFPVFWLPGLHLNTDKDRPPLRRVEIGSSRRLGTEVRTIWGGNADEAMSRVAEAFGVEGPVKGDWGFMLANYTDRGVFYEPSWEYETASSKGKLFGAYIRDRSSQDFQPNSLPRLEDKTRGRVDLQHRTRLDDEKVIDIELSYLSDSEFLREYYESESRIGKEQETYVNYRDVSDNNAFSLLARGRLNDFQSQAEYLPHAEWRRTGEVLDLGVLGEPVLTQKSFVDAVRYAPGEDPTSPDPQEDSRRNTRAGTAGSLTWPFDLENGDRVQLKAGYDVTAFDRTVDVPDDPSITGVDTTQEGTGDVRYALTGGAEWSRTYSGTGEAQSETWNLDGVRQILEPRAGYLSVFELNDRPPDLVQIDEVEQLDLMQRFELAFRHRIQTHQDNQVKTILDTDVSVPFYPNEGRDNPVLDVNAPGGVAVYDQDEGRTSGDIVVDTRWTPGARLFALRQAMVRWRATIDPNGWGYKRSFLSYETRIDETKSFAVSENKARHASNFVSAGVEWELTQRWTTAVFFERDQLTKESARRGVVLRQRAECWMMDLELSQRRGTNTIGGGSSSNRDRDESRVSLRFWPRVGGRSEESLLQRLGRVR
ncbi:MAG: hypothetical protein DHS20C15_18260 [Planctomycetota bacterium]|nr:MAG: hypothetical protein DHS20C15_18260 [Planctomycetota bacterium]